MPFFIATADSTGARIANSTVQLAPQPTRVEYPSDPTGTLVVTADGNVVQQQPSKDSRMYAWEWHGYPSWQANYAPLYARLEGLRSRYRKELGLSAYIYVKDSETGKLRRRVASSVAGNVTAGGSVFTASGSPAWTVGQFLSGSLTHSVDGIVFPILSNTASTITVSGTFSTTAAITANLTYFTEDWVRARVLKVYRTLRDDGGDVRYPTTRFEFVLDDTSWNALG